MSSKICRPMKSKSIMTVLPLQFRQLPPQPHQQAKVVPACCRNERKRAALLRNQRETTSQNSIPVPLQLRQMTLHPNQLLQQVKAVPACHRHEKKLTVLQWKQLEAASPNANTIPGWLKTCSKCIAISLTVLDRFHKENVRQASSCFVFCLVAIM